MKIVKIVLAYITQYKGWIMAFVAMICLYALLQIRMGMFWPVGNVDNPDSANIIVENISYSYIAAYVFYLLTVGIPNVTRKYKLKSIIQENVKNIGTKEIHSILLEFGRETGIKADYHDVEHTAYVLNSKNWDFVVPMILKYQGVSITYFQYMYRVCDCIKETISFVKNRFNNDLTINQLVALEELSEMKIFKTLDSLIKFPNMKVDDGRKSLIEEFVEMQTKYLKVEALFGISKKTNGKA